MRAFMAVVIVLGMSAQALAVWPPSTALQGNIPTTLSGSIVLAFVIGIAIGIWTQRNHDEHK